MARPFVITIASRYQYQLGINTYYYLIMSQKIKAVRHN